MATTEETVPKTEETPARAPDAEPSKDGDKPKSDPPGKKSWCGKDGICHKIFCHPLNLGIKTLYWVLAAVTCIVALYQIIMAGFETGIMMEFNAAHTGNVAAFIILAVTTIGTIVLSIWGPILICSSKGTNKALRVDATLLFVMLLIQVLIVSLVAVPNRHEEQSILKQLTLSFNDARSKPNEQNKWTSTQSSLKCCGVFGPEDYRPSGLTVFTPPDVPISCCPGYNSKVSAALQEREREICKAKREYFNLGCKDPVLNGIKDLGRMTISVVAILAFLQLIEILVFCIAKRKDKEAPPQPPAP